MSDIYSTKKTNKPNLHTCTYLKVDISLNTRYRSKKHVEAVMAYPLPRGDLSLLPWPELLFRSSPEFDVRLGVDALWELWPLRLFK